MDKQELGKILAQRYNQHKKRLCKLLYYIIWH